MKKRRPPEPHEPFFARTAGGVLLHHEYEVCYGCGHIDKVDRPHLMVHGATRETERSWRKEVAEANKHEEA